MQSQSHASATRVGVARAVARSIRIAVATITLVCVSVTLAACGGGGGAGDEGPVLLPLPSGGAGGRLAYIQQSATLAQDIEPNDDVTAAQRLSDGYPGQSSILFGGLDVPGGDALDAFRIRFPQRSDVTARLTYDETANDFSLAYYDPMSMQFIRVATGAEPTITMLARGVIDFVVIGNSGAGNYELSVTVEVTPLEIAENEPNNTVQAARLLGEIRHGDRLTIVGETVATADALDAFVVACPQDADVAFELQIPAFSNTVLRVSDITGDLNAPSVLATFGGPVSQTRTGTVNVNAGTLLLVEVESLEGNGFWRLVTSARAPGSTKPGRMTPGSIGNYVQAPQSQIALLTSEADAVSLPTPYGRTPHEMIAGQTIVRFREGRAAEAERTLSSSGCRLQQDAPSFCLMSFDLPAGQSVEQQARQTFGRCCMLCGGAGIDYAEPNHVVRPLKVPNDELYELQSWHYEMLNLPNAWEITTGSANTIVAVIDTGRLNHPDLDARQIAGYDFVIGQYAGDGDGLDANPDDHGVQTSYHGGHCAGTIGAASDNSIGVAGVTWATRIMPIRALGDYGVGTDFDVANAILYAAGLTNNSGTTPATAADIISMSLGGSGSSQTTDNACASAKQQGLVLFAAAGNSNSTAPSYPAAYSSVISIVALDAYSGRAPYSNYGPTVTLSAPGGDQTTDADGDGYSDGVLSTGRDSAGPTYRFLQGTSMACPHAAGVAALLLAQDATLMPAQVEAILKNTAVDLGAAGRDDTFGWGLIDAHAALLSLLPPPAPLPPVLELRPRTVNLGSAQFTASVFIRNAQPTGTRLEVNDATVVTDDGGSWLTADLVGPPNGNQNFSSINLIASRTSLAVGAYRAVVTVTSNGGDQDLIVLMQVISSIPPPPNIDIFVRAISAETGQVVQERIVNPSTSLFYEFAALPIGEYVFTAGTDIDRDGVLCEEGDFCGEYPSRGEARTIRVTRGTVLSNLDFTVLRELTVSPLGD